MIQSKLYQQVLTLNNAAVPHVNELALSDLAALIDGADFADCLQQDDAIQGFLIALHSGNDYHGYHFRWFQSRYDDFLYIDRIVVNPEYRGLGIGRRLYERAIAWCQVQNVGNLMCEVNDDPPNPGSHHFHQTIGFNKIESIQNPVGKTVCMYHKSLAT